MKTLFFSVQKYESRSVENGSSVALNVAVLQARTCEVPTIRILGIVMPACPPRVSWPVDSIKRSRETRASEIPRESETLNYTTPHGALTRVAAGILETIGNIRNARLKTA